ncbi:MAG: ArsR/SmtB family transcription factor [Halobacteria archaeon]
MSSEGEEPDARVIGLDSEDVDQLMSALSSETSREILQELHQEKMTASSVAERIDGSVQNARYHLQKLEDAGLIEVVDMEYSPKGREMDVYEATGSPLVIFSGVEESSGSDILKRLAGAFLGLGAVSVLVNYLANEFYYRDRAERFKSSGGKEEPSAGAGAGSGGDTSTPSIKTENATGGEAAQSIQAENTAEAHSIQSENASRGADYAAERAPEAAEAARGTLETFPPGLLFFAGGALILTVLAVWWYFRKRRSRMDVSG